MCDVNINTTGNFYIFVDILIFMERFLYICTSEKFTPKQFLENNFWEIDRKKYKNLSLLAIQEEDE